MNSREMDHKAPGRTIAIGDIHGCSSALDRVLTLIAPRTEDCIITLGDYIDRGPDSRGVIDRLIELQSDCRFIPLLGNHELLLFATMADSQHSSFWMECGGRETLDSYDCGLDSFPEDHLEFLRNCQPYFETDSHMFLHANYEAGRPLPEQREYVLYWEHLSNGIPQPHVSGKTVIVGHTPQAGGRILDLEHVVCIDTYCFGGGCLTAFDVDTKEVWQADKQGNVWQPPN